MKKIQAVFIFGVLLVAILILALAFDMAQTHNNAFAEEVDSIQEQVNVAIHNDINIWDYITDFNSQRNNQTIGGSNHLYGQNVSFATGGQNNALCTLTVFGDDNIVTAIPRNLFMEPTTEFHMGNEYGYLITTNYNGDYYQSVVIIVRVQMVMIGGDFTYTLSTEARLAYCFVCSSMLVEIENHNTSGSVRFCDVILSNGVTSAVVPLMQYEQDTNEYAIVAETNKYSIANVDVLTTVFNQNSFNVGESQYSAIDDCGYFVIDNEYSYSLSKKGITPNEIVSEISTGVLEFALGRLPKISAIISFFRSVYSIYSSLTTVPNVNVYYSNTSELYEYTTPIYYTSLDQINHYGYLVKTTAALIYDNSSYSYCCDPGDRIIATISYAHKDGYNEYNRVFILVNIDLIDNSNNGWVGSYNNEQYVYYDINTPQSTNIGVTDEVEYYMTPFATKIFSFTAPYNATYALDVDGDVGAVTINNNTVIGVNGKYIFEGAANTQYTIVLDNNGSICTGSVSIDIESNNGSIPAGQTRLVKYTLPFDGLIQWNTGNVNVSMLEIFTYNNGFSVYKVGGVVSFSETVGGALPMPTGTYYILVSNSASISVSITLSATLCSFTNSNIISNLAVQGQYYFISLSPSYVDGYMLTVDSNDALVFSTYIILYGIGGNVGLITGNHATCQPSPQMQPLYVGVSVGSVGPAIVNLRIEHVEDSLQWTVDGEIVSSIVSLGRNDSYQIGVVLNGIYSDLYAIIMDNIITGLLIDGTTLRISDSIPLDSTVYEITAKPSAVTSFDPKFRFRLKEDDKLLLSSYNNGSGCGFNIQLNKTGISWLTYNFYNENNSVISNGTVVTTEGINQYTIAVTTGGTSRLVRLGINQTSRNGDNRTFFGSVSVDSWFGGGTGTASDPNLITYPWQFNNIYRATSQCFKQTSNLNFSNIGTRRGVSFYGTYNAFSHSITGINMSITYSNEAYIGGMFDRNYGTITGLTQFSATISVVSATNATVDVGGIVGYNVNGASITGLCAFCTVSSDSKVSSSHIGGLVGYNCGTMWVPLQDNITVQGYCNIGGVAGRNVGTLNTAMMACEIHYSRVSSAANCSVGGIAGKNTGTINVDFLYSDIDILIDNISGNKTNRPRVGLLVGENNSGTVTVTGDTPFGSIDADDLIPVCQTYINFNGNIGYDH